MAICNAIISTGGNIISAINKGEGSGGDALKKSVDAVQNMLVPHWAEDTKKRAARARETLIKEASRGQIKIKVLGKDHKTKKRR